MDNNMSDGRSLSILSSSNCYNKTRSNVIINSDKDDQTMIIELEYEDLRRGPWTTEEDLTLINYISNHGDGRWNTVARCAGLKRTGKSCRLRWLNYLRPDVRRGNITLDEQLLILQLHSRWGNRWSKIAQQLPGRTDNEIKNYWRTQVQKHVRQLKCDVNSKQFRDTMRCLWMPRVVERFQAASQSTVTTEEDYCSENTNSPYYNTAISDNNAGSDPVHMSYSCTNISDSEYDVAPLINNSTRASYTNDNQNSSPASSDSFGAQVSSLVSNLTHNYSNDYLANYNITPDNYYFHVGYMTGSLITPSGSYNNNSIEQNYEWSANDAQEDLWGDQAIWSLQQQFNNTI